MVFNSTQRYTIGSFCKGVSSERHRQMRGGRNCLRFETVAGGIGPPYVPSIDSASQTALPASGVTFKNLSVKLCSRNYHLLLLKGKTEKRVAQQSLFVFRTDAVKVKNVDPYVISLFCFSNTYASCCAQDSIIVFSFFLLHL